MFEPAARLPSAHGSEPVVTPANRLFVRGPALRQRTDVTQNMSRKTKAAGNAPRLPRPCTAGTFMRLLRCLEPSPTTSVARSCCGAGEEGFEPSHAGIKIRCLNQLGDSPIRLAGTSLRLARRRKDAHFGAFPKICQLLGCKFVGKVLRCGSQHAGFMARNAGHRRCAAQAP